MRVQQARILSLVLLLLLVILPAAPVFAQEAEPAGVAGSEPPVLLVDDEVTSFSVPSPGLFWQTAGFCPPRPPAAATVDDSPQAVDRATDFTIKRMTVRGEEKRTVMRRVDPTPVTDPEWVCDQYGIRSNIVADGSFIYWVDSTGLVRLPVTANPWDNPETVEPNYSGSQPVELLMTPDRVLGLINIPGSQIQLASSEVFAWPKTGGTAATLKFNLFNRSLNSPGWDGKYVYYRNGSLDLIRLDSAGNEFTIANAVGPYVAEGLDTFCPTIQCFQTEYVFYAKGNVIRRFNNINGQDDVVQTRAGNIRTVLAAPRGLVGFLLGNSLYWFESITEPCGLLLCPTTYTLYRAGRSPGSQAEPLYFYIDNSSTPVSPMGLTSDGDYLFWKEGTQFIGDVKRLPNDVESLPKVDMAVTGYEVTQGVQKNDNSVRLVQGRSTFVRVFVQSLGAGSIAGANMRLYATVNNIEQGPIIPLEQTHLTVKTAPNRNTLGDSFLFQLPHDWTITPQISLRAVLNPFQVPPEPTYANNQITGDVAFSQAYPLKLILYEANYRIQRSLNDFDDWNVTDIGSNISYIRRAYPIAEDGLEYMVRTINGGALLGNRVLQVDKVCTDMPAASRSLCASDWVMAKIGEMAANPNFNVPGDYYLYGLIVDSQGSGGAFPRGQAGGRIGAGPTGTFISSASYSDYGYYTGHEVGHMLGRPHPSPNSDDPATTVDGAGNPIVEGCGHSRSDNSFPYALARIGPGDGSLRGFDRAGNRTGGWARPAVLDDINSFDMMSYCGNSQIRWPSDYTWENMYQWLKNDAETVAAAGARTVFGGEQLAVFGSLYGNTVAVQNVARLSGSLTPPPAGPGILTLRQLAADNSLLSATQFEPEESSDTGRPFAVVVPLAGGARRVQIVATAGGQLLFERAISANAPVVSSLTLPGASNPVTGTVTVAWSASDADGGSLAFDLYYSFDGGGTFQPVLFGATGTSAQVDTSTLGGGTGIFRIVASDGVNQGTLDSAQFQIAVKPPKVFITSPPNGAVFNWGQLVQLSGDALDSLDGLLPGGSLLWSNQYGVLGTGSVLSISSLPVGVNVITLSAQNSAGQSASAQVSITVGDVLQLPGPQLAVTPEELGFQFAAGSTSPASQSLSLTNIGADVTTSWTASSSAPWLTLSSSSGANLPATIQVTASPQGLTPGVEHHATIIVTGTPTGGTAQQRVIPVSLTIGNNMATSLNGVSGAPGQLKVFLPFARR